MGLISKEYFGQIWSTSVNNKQHLKTLFFIPKIIQALQFQYKRLSKNSNNFHFTDINLIVEYSTNSIPNKQMILVVNYNIITNELLLHTNWKTIKMLWQCTFQQILNAQKDVRNEGDDIDWKDERWWIIRDPNKNNKWL